MTKSNTILGITLEGFQVFAEPTYIPLDRLTLMFGPNSAGKSAVHDAIETFEALSDSRQLQGFGYGRASALLKRHWRRTSSTEFVEAVRIAVTHTTSCSVDSVVADYMGRELAVDYLTKDTLQLESCWILHRLDDDDDADFNFLADFEFFIESELFVSSVGTSLRVNLQHPIVCNIPLSVDFAEVAKTYPDEVSYVDGFFTYFSGIQGFLRFPSLNTDPNDSWLWYLKEGDGVFGYKTYHDSKIDPEYKFFFDALREINLLVGITLAASNGNTNFRSSKVEASRNVPTRSELTFQFRGFDDDMLPEYSGGDTRFKGLAESISGSVVHSSDPARWHQNTPLYAASVNRALTDHLFIEQGYSIDFDYRVLLSKENSQAAVSEEFLDPTGFGYLVELFLRDHAGRRHFFEDVGSGIGYVLPVLCALYEKSQGTYFIQQPELHLHPALQAAMGDVLIEASANNQLLIETHSEHLLLRVLKRIRQTGLHVDIADDLKIDAQDVCVLYFDPQLDGTTKVKRLRISEDGEFMDRWPRGFFAERDQELLDE